MSTDLSLNRELACSTIASAGAALTGAARSSPDTPVPWCPGWTTASVLAHIGCVHEWVVGMVRSRTGEPSAFPDPPKLSGDTLADWADQARSALIEALAGADLDRPMWAFGSQRPTRFWARRQAHETAVHAVDATGVAGKAWQIPAEVADDGLEEFLTVLLPLRWQRRAPEWALGRSVHFHRTDGDGERVLTIASPPRIRAGHGSCDLAVRGSAQDLLLWALNRPATVELIGDDQLAGAWGDHVRL